MHRSVRHRLLRTAAPLLALLVVAVPAAQAAAPWMPPIDIGSGASDPVSALSGTGNAVAAWHAGTAVAIYRSRTTRAWNAPFVSTGQPVTTQPSVAAGGNGAAVAYESGGEVYAAVYESGAWQAALPFGPGSEPRVGMDAAGNALLAWIDSAGVVNHAVRAPAGSWASGALPLSAPGADELDLAVNAGGAAIASWRMPLTGAHAAVGTTGGFAGAGSAIDPAAISVTGVDAAIGADGTVAVVWAEGGDIRAGYGTGGTFTIGTVAGGPADSPAVAVDANGLALAGWRTDAGAVQWDTSADGAWSGAGTTLGAAAEAGSVVAAANGNGGDLALGWVASGSAHTAVRPPAGGWDTETHGPASATSVAVDDAGDVLSVWQGASSARTSTYDSSAPTLSASVPASAAAGQSVNMTATATDLWSATGAPSWNFGDGGTASGTSVNHAWTAAGTETVTVNVTDAAGNAAPQVSDSISITAAPPANSTAPSVSGGGYRDGTQLSASNGSWSGTATISYDHQWQVCAPTCVDIPGAVAQTYTPTATDVGSTLRVVVTASNAGGAVAAPSNQTPAIAPLATSAASVSGTWQDGATLSANPGGFNGATDLSYRYQWQRCAPGCSDISGATAATYTTAAADVGTTIKVSVDARKGGSAWTDGPVSAASAPIAPRQTAAPVVTGTAKDSMSLGTDNGGWNGVTSLTHTYLWERCTSSDPATCDGAYGTNSTRAASAADVGFRFRVRVTASKGGSVAIVGAFSTPSAVVAPLNTAAPVLTLASPKDGTAASTTDGVWNGAALDSITRQWQRCDTAGANCVGIAGATGASYTLGPDDVGSKVRSLVTASKNGGAASQPTPVSGIIAPLNTGAAVIVSAGTPKDGNQLSASPPGAWNGATALAYTYEWRRCDSTGASCNTQVGTSATHVPGAADVGSTLKLIVSASKNGSASTVAPISLQSGVIAPRNTQAPAANGTATDGQTLTVAGATATAWNGATGLTITQEWVRCDYPAWTTCAAIPAQIGATYVLASDDVDDKIKVRVTAAKSGVATVAESVLSAVVAPRAPSFGTGGTPFPINQTTGTGTFRVGHSATANPGPWNGTQPLTYTYSWRSCPTPMHPSSCPEVGTGAQFAIPESMLGKWLSFLVTARTSNLSGPQLTSPSPWFSPGTQIADNTLSVLEAPVLSGNPVDGSTITSSEPVWDPAHSNNDYHWQRCTTTEPPDSCDPIPGALSRTYVLTPDDVGKYIALRIRGSFAPDFADAWTEFTTAVVTARRPANTAAPTLSGTAAIGSVLSAAPGSWDGTPTIAFAYQWLRCDAAGGACAAIAGATSADYGVTEADAAHTLRARVTASNGGGAMSSDSTASAVVATPPPPLTATSGAAPAAGGTTPPPAGGATPLLLSGKDRKAPVVKLRLAPGARTVLSGARFLVRVTCPKGERSCTGKVEVRGDVLGATKALRRGIKVASARFKLKGGKSATVRLALGASAQRTLNAHGKLRAQLRAIATDAAGNKGVGKAKVTLVRPRNKTLGKSSGA